MKFELQFKVYGDLKIQNNNIEIKKHPYLIKLFEEEENQFYISISKQISLNSDCLPKINNSNGIYEVVLPKQSAYSEMIEYINHIESFASVDNKIVSIDKINIIFSWIPENDDDHYFPFTKIQRSFDNEHELDFISEEWLSQTIIHKRQLGELYLPFSFFKEGKNMFHSGKYQTAFCTFYMMLEYFFHDEKRGWGINNNAYKTYVCLEACINKTLLQIQSYQQHHNWLKNELKQINKNYNVEDFLSLIIKFRNDFSHASDKNKNRNNFKEHEYFSLAFITLMLCKFVSIKQRLSPFVHPNEREIFYKR